MMVYFSPGEYVKGRYLVRDIKKGGIGLVYLCHDEFYDIPVALKTIHFESAEQLQSLSEGFINGVKKWILVGHNQVVVHAYNFFTLETDDGLIIPYLAMELVEGDPRFGNSLWGWIHKSGLDLQLTLFFAHAICSGMIQIQKILGKPNSDFVHLDLKPQNILVSREGTLKITDIGLAKSLQKGASFAQSFPRSFLTQDGYFRFGATKAICGTPPYMSPEQCTGLQSFDQRSDIYSFGCILYEMCTKKFIFQTTSPDDFIEKHVHERPISPKKWNPDIPDSVRWLIEKCLSKDPEDRPQNFKEVLNFIKKVLESEGLPSGIGFDICGFSIFSENPRVKSEWDMREEEEAFLLAKVCGVEYIIKQGLVKSKDEFEKLLKKREATTAEDRSKESREYRQIEKVNELVSMGDSLFQMAEILEDQERVKLIRSALSKYSSAHKLMSSEPRISFRLGLAYCRLAALIREENRSLSDELITLATKKHDFVLEKEMSPILDVIGTIYYILPFHALWHRAAAFAIGEQFEKAVKDLESLLSWIDRSDLSEFSKFSEELKQRTMQFLELVLKEREDNK